MANEVLPKLFSKTSSIDINERHGTVLAIGEIVAKLKLLENESNNEKTFINESITEQLNGLVQAFQERDQFRGLSGEMMYQCCCDFIKNCSASKIAASPDCIGNYLNTLKFFSWAFSMVCIMCYFRFLAIGD